MKNRMTIVTTILLTLLLGLTFVLMGVLNNDPTIGNLGLSISYISIFVLLITIVSTSILRILRVSSPIVSDTMRSSYRRERYRWGFNYYLHLHFKIQNRIQSKRTAFVAFFSFIAVQNFCIMISTLSFLLLFTHPLSMTGKGIVIISAIFSLIFSLLMVGEIYQMIRITNNGPEKRGSSRTSGSKN